MWKIITAQIRDIYSLRSRGLLPEEQKCRKVTTGTGKLLYKYQHNFNEGKARRKNLPTAGIDKKWLTIWAPKAGYYTVLKCMKYLTKS